MRRLLLADRVKGRVDSFLAPLIPALAREWDVRFVSLPPGAELAAAIAWCDVLWLEWCWDHAVWATREGLAAGRPTILRLHSVEALGTAYPERVDWSRIDRLVTVGEDIAQVIRELVPGAAPIVIPNGVDLARFRPVAPDPTQVAWVGHIEPKKNPMLLLQIAARLRGSHAFHVAGPFTDRRTRRYVQHLAAALGLGGTLHLHGPVADMPHFLADKGVILSTSMYESFGLNIAEGMSCGLAPVVHDFPGADLLWPAEALFASVDEAVALIRAARPGAHWRAWTGRYSLDHQVAATRDLLAGLDPARRGARQPLAPAISSAAPA
ncbi:MAG: glycosyltransferase family 4 protein [Rhodospirillales bacterium]|nr:glycosyltransferase family 4 protein [Rhodospirillales bacterium]